MSQIIGKQAKNEMQQCDNVKPFFQEAGSSSKNAWTLYSQSTNERERQQQLSLPYYKIYYDVYY